MLYYGLNHLEKCKSKSDYFFTRTGAIWGWATWRRAWQYYDYYLNNFDESKLPILNENIKNKYVAKQKIENWRGTKKRLDQKENIFYWDVQWGHVKYVRNKLVVTPRLNQINNIGIGEFSTHARRLKTRKYKKYRTFCFISTHNFDFPLVEPKEIICNEKYDKEIYNCPKTLKNKIYRIINIIIKIRGNKNVK